MSALVKRGILLPDCEGFVSKRETRTALMRFGVSGKATRETTDANFDHLPGSDDEKRLNLFAMNTITPDGDTSQSTTAREHFRSTGIRDTPDGPDASRYEHFDAFQRAVSHDFTQAEVSRAIAAFDVDPGHTNVYGEQLASNDVNQHHPKRVDQADRPGPLCPPAASVTSMSIARGEPDESDPCHSNLHGSISFMFQEMGTPTGAHARMTAAEMRQLFLASEMPQGALDRSPATCSGGAYGCDTCYDEYAAAPAFASYKATLRHRYCRCMMITDFEISGGFSPTSPADIRLPGFLSFLDQTYASTCREPVGGDTDAACAPYCFAGGGPAIGHYGGNT